MEYPTGMKIRRIEFAREFTDCPGGRFRKYGEFSGEEFRESLLLPALTENDRVIVQMDGVLGFPASFLDEAFGILTEKIGRDAIKNKLTIELTDNRVALAEIADCIEKHLEITSGTAVAA
jgi:hypothetical protein